MNPSGSDVGVSLSHQYKGTLTPRKTNSDPLLLNVQSKLTVFKVKIHCQSQRMDEMVDLGHFHDHGFFYNEFTICE